MTITKNADCTEITIDSEYFSDFINETNDVTAITVYYSVNGAEEESYELAIDDEYFTAETLVLNMEFFNQDTEALVDGVYCFRLLIVQDEDEITQYGNVLVDCALLCNLAEYVWNNPLLQLHAKYEAIKYFQQCNTCDCDTVYLLYQDLLTDLDSGINNDCGC